MRCRRPRDFDALLSISDADALSMIGIAGEHFATRACGRLLYALLAERRDAMRCMID